MPPETTLRFDQIRLICEKCFHHTTITRIRWRRIKPRMACGHCRKVTTWRPA